MTLTKMQGSLVLFILLVVILMTNPSFYTTLYNNVLGRVFLILLLIFFATNNVTLGLLVALIIIIGTNVYFVEGMENKSAAKLPVNAMASDNAISGAIAKLNYSDNIANTQSGTTIGDDNVNLTPSTGTIQVITGSKTVSDLKKASGSKKESFGTDRVSLQESMTPKQSNQHMVSKAQFGSQEVAPASSLKQEGFSLIR
jgi:uncharacterized protein (UPF0333 family)